MDAAKIKQFTETLALDDNAKVVIAYFTGAVYENQNTAIDDTARRFEASEFKVRDALFTISGNSQSFGSSSNQRFIVPTGDTIGIALVDLSTLYFKNTTPGQNGVVTVLAVVD